MNCASIVEEISSCRWATASAAFVFIIGCFYLIKFTFDIGRFCFHLLLPPIHFKRFGKWVVVTGATDGIGKAYAIEFAKRGLNLCLISRSDARLTEVTEELKTKYKIETQQMAIDFSTVTDSQWSDVRDMFDKLEVGILINNVGCSYEHPEYLHLIDDAVVDRLIRINILATVKMTKLALTGMLKRKKGMILNIGSAAGTFVPSSPLLAVYGGTKAFTELFTKSCNVEYKNKGILFQDQAPFFVTTKMSKIRRASLMTPSPQNWVKGAMQQIGNGPLTAGYWVHNVMAGILNKIPPPLVNAYVLSFHLKLRSKALKKIEAAKKE